MGCLDRRVLSAPLVSREVQAKHRVMIAVLFAVGNRQASEPTKRHSGTRAIVAPRLSRVPDS